jgi:hypothetical protein
LFAGWGNVSLTRARHAKEVKDDADVVLIIGEASRFTTQDSIISYAQIAMELLGARNVILVATNMDVSSIIMCSIVKDY